MTVVDQVEVYDIALPPRRHWRWRGLGEDLGRWSIVKITTDDGVVGWGEATALRDWGGDDGRYFGETPVTVRHVIEDIITPLIVGHDPFEVEAAWIRMDEAIRGHVYAKAAVDIALFDVMGKLLGQPLYQLLGGRVRPGVEVAHMIGIMDRDEAVAEALAAAEDGIQAFQIKGTGEVARDVEIVRALRDAVGPAFTLRLDANQGYRRRGAKAAIRAVRQLEEAGVDLIEQPTEGLRHMSATRAAVDIGVIADESCWQPHDVVEVAAQQAAEAISIYIAKAGGILRAGRVAAVAETFGLPCDVNGSLESGVGNAANLHFAVSTPCVTLACVIPISAPSGTGDTVTAGRYYADDIVSKPFRFAAGLLYAPDGPGLGFEIDEEKLDAYRVDPRRGDARVNG